MLKVRPHTKSGGGQSTSGPIYDKLKWGGGGGGGGQFASGPIRKVGEGGNSLQVRYEKWGREAIRFRSDTKSGGGGGGGGDSLRVRYEKEGGSHSLHEKWGGGGGGGGGGGCLAQRKYFIVN